MIDQASTIFLFLKDYTESSLDRYFLFKDGALAEVTSADVVAVAEPLVCHDYWLIAPSLYAAVGALPNCVIDLDEFAAAISGSRDQRKQRDRKSITEALGDNAEHKEVISKYSKIFHKALEFDSSLYAQAAELLLTHWRALINQAQVNDELARQSVVEVPVFNLLYSHVVKGICIDVEALREHKAEIDYQYYSALKNFSKKHNFPLEVPSDVAITQHLEPLGFDFSGISIDYVLRFLPTPQDFAAETLRLRKLAESKVILASLPYSRKIATPIVDVFGSITSRIYFKNPVFQNLARRYRNIIVPSNGCVLSYVDYDQFEVGIMAALSDDQQMLSLYSSRDIYAALSIDIFGVEEKRKIAKKLFLSYAYGMRIKSLVDAAVEQGADRAKVKAFFANFAVFEDWKKSVVEQFEANGKIGTSCGNFQRREGDSPITEKEKRACVSQVVQGTASLIFKKSLLRLGSEAQVRILIPMHDGVLVEHPPEYNSTKLTAIFSDVMTEHFSQKVVGKASLEPFAPIQ